MNFELLEFMFMVFHKYIVIYGRNPWLMGFIEKFLQGWGPLPASLLQRIKLNHQIEPISIVYLHDSGTPLLKILLKVQNKTLEVNLLKL